MKAFIFIVLIPCAAGVISAINGVGYFDGNLGLAMAINLPICIASTAIHLLTEG